MRKIIATVTMLLGALFLTSVLAMPVSAAQADAPEFDAGTGWGVGQEIALDWKWSDMSPTQKAAIASMMASLGMEVDELSLSADAAFYAMLKVDEVTDDEYVVAAKMAVKLAASGSLKMSGEMPKTGNYDIVVADLEEELTWDDLWDLDYSKLGIQMEDKTVSAGLSAEFALIFEGTLHLEKENLAIKSVEMSVGAAAVISFNANNIPMIEEDFIYGDSYYMPSNILVNVSYENYDVKIKAAFDAKLSAEFEPALNIYEFPLQEGNTWTIDSEATVSGELSGFLDVTGLPEEAVDEMFEEGPLAEMGFTGFPITFDDLELGDIEVKDGKIEPFTVPIYAELECIGEETIDVFGTDKTVYVIEADMGDESMEFIYSSDLIDLFASVAMMDMGDLPFDLSMLEAMGVTVENKDVTAEQADAEIQSIKSYESGVADKARGGGEFPVMYIVAFLAIVAVAVVAVVFFIRKK